MILKPKKQPFHVLQSLHVGQQKWFCEVGVIKPPEETDQGSLKIWIHKNDWARVLKFFVISIKQPNLHKNTIFGNLLWRIML